MKTRIVNRLPIIAIIIVMIVVSMLFIPSDVNAEQNTVKTFKFSDEIVNLSSGKHKMLYVMESSKEVSEDTIITWKSSDKKTAKVKKGNSDGLVQAVKLDNAFITAIVSIPEELKSYYVK